jgi:hypothetical protein
VFPQHYVNLTAPRAATAFRKKPRHRLRGSQLVQADQECSRNREQQDPVQPAPAGVLFSIGFHMREFGGP